MLQYNEVKPKKFIVYEGEPWEVMSSHVFRKQQRKPVNQVRLKNLISGRVLDHSFKQTDTLEEADLEKREVKYLYKNDKKSPVEIWFCEVDNPKERFVLDEGIVGENVKYMKENEAVTALLFSDKIIGIKLPIKLDLKVVETPPNIKGATRDAGNKPATLETGASVSVPMFIEEGTTITVNTETGEYVGKI